jgi:glycosyltransferase involved in cell wall biosynthesis
MKVYYYHTVDVDSIYRQWQDGTFPGHFLYGATHLPHYGMEVVLHQPIRQCKRWKLSLHTAWKILTCREHFDIIYASTFRGLELIIFLRAIGLFRRPVCVWHHQPIVKAKNPVRELIARLFYRGMDGMFFFSQKLIDDSLSSAKAKPERMFVARWGADLEYYDRLAEQYGDVPRHGFISTGKELRDMPTLVEAFDQTSAPLDIYICPEYLGINYEELFADLIVNDNIHVHFVNGMVHREMSKLVNSAQCVVICCHKANYTVGLTTVVEALALGLPLICTRNVQIPIDIDREGCGITVEPGDVDGWVKAVNYVAGHPDEAAEMGRRGRQLAEQEYNIENCAHDVAAVLNKQMKKR